MSISSGDSLEVVGAGGCAFCFPLRHTPVSESVLSRIGVSPGQKNVPA